VVALFALLGLFQLLLALLGAVALIRYRAMVPFVYLFLLIQMLGNRGVALLRPMTETAAPGSAISLGLLAATLLGFVLSLLNVKR
jgi:cyanate permease